MLKVLFDFLAKVADSLLWKGRKVVEVCQLQRSGLNNTSIWTHKEEIEATPRDTTHTRTKQKPNHIFNPCHVSLKRFLKRKVEKKKSLPIILKLHAMFISFCLEAPLNNLHIVKWKLHYQKEAVVIKLSWQAGKSRNVSILNPCRPVWSGRLILLTLAVAAQSGVANKAKQSCLKTCLTNCISERSQAPPGKQLVIKPTWQRLCERKQAGESWLICLSVWNHTRSPCFIR